ncbi:NUDIX hydrolase [Acaryochloris marina]|uniref:NUDIX hydrolase n=1 Tax=Acaryochloris marina (strain MBIC 11017) TaxID=329726 RepID=B0CBV7_ACAM1|nr:NUDIX domain-containing protein [Acaryochloris marina]ABW30357.1 NUDIX hydrolase [Acaryochloris marina MBIC11017]BDM79178.1 NUDIX hydrolase [Acaryochloris marina MBIC10699]
MTSEDNAHDVAIAILYQQDQYLMQLRDDIPGIAYPGHWGFFGGHCDPGEHPDDAIHRELIEELGYQTSNIKLFDLYPDPGVVRHVYYAPLTVSLSDLELMEGWDWGFFSPQQIQESKRYSQKAQGIFPLAYPHQKILLDFMVFQSHQDGIPKKSPID